MAVESYPNMTDSSTIALFLIRSTHIHAPTKSLFLVDKERKSRV